ncbi:hypothetical protein H0N96_02460 [Candidatus Micrarchaeota archaeon]|nr:hypothetical protein [Candidatus Micrarchaeota archaeon]
MILMTYNKGTFFERELKHRLEDKGFFVVRASGSGCDGVSPDLIALHTTKKFAVECKAWRRAPRIEGTKFKILSEWQATTGMPLYIAWKSPRKEWRFFPLSFLKESPLGYALAKNDLEAGLTLGDLLR